MSYVRNDGKEPIMSNAMRKAIAKITAAAEAKGIREGSRVVFRKESGDAFGTVKAVQYEDVRVVWDEPAISGVTATWISLAKLEPVA